MRIFISINPDDSAKESLLEIQNELKAGIAVIDKNLLKKINWTDKDKFHITLFFIGEINEKKIIGIDNCLSKIKSGVSVNEINLRFNSVNAFPNLKNPRVLIVEQLQKDKRIVLLSEKISKILNKINLESDKTFQPHITLGRVRKHHKINLMELENKIKFELNFTADEIHLMESKLKSNGSEYSVFKTYKYK